MDLLHGWGLEIAKGALVTISVALLSLAVGMIWGILGALALLSQSKALARIGNAYTTLVRGTPELLIILIIYFGGTVALTKLMRLVSSSATYVEVPSLVAGVFALSLVFGGFAAEVLRGAYLAIPKGQIEAADAFGMSGYTSFVYIKFPQMWRLALPGLGNQWISLVKDTSLISVVGLEELMRVSFMATSVAHEPFRFYLVASIIYLLLNTANTSLLQFLEAHASRGERRA
jgi:His/Glu/Gln/Arg/opine family amino acid ABC transporter permease subunit